MAVCLFFCCREILKTLSKTIQKNLVVDRSRFRSGDSNLGLREGEVCGLMWDAVDLDQRMFAVRRKYQKKISVLEEFTKGKKIRTLGIYPDALLERMRNQRSLFPRSDFVVCRPQGEMVTPMQLIVLLQNGIKATGISRVTFHGLRHTFATLYMQSGGDLYDLQKIMGHEDVSTTERYRHTDPEYLRLKCGVLNLYEKSETTQVSSAQIPPKTEKPVLRLVL
jgi:integrase